MSPTFLTMTAFFATFYSVLRFSVVVPRVLQISESCFYSRVFITLHSFPTFCITCLYQGFPRSQQFFLEGCRNPRWGLKHRPGPLVYLNHTVFQQKVLVSSFYLFVKALRNTISISSRFWTLSVIATYTLKCRSYPLGFRRSKWILVYKRI